MKLLLLLVLNFNQVLASTSQDFQTGDLILISLRCYACPLMESETDGDYSHSGVVVRDGEEIKVAQALGKVHLLSLDKFLAQRRSESQFAHLRPIQKIDSQKLKRVYFEEFEALAFDSEYLWDNFDQYGNELLYCSEFVAKLYNRVANASLSPSPMDFSRHWDTWRSIFRKEPPQGELGNSPNSLYRSSFFRLIKKTNR